MRNEIDGNGSVLVGTASLKNAEKSSKEEAEHLAFLLVAQKPHLLGRVQVLKLKPREDRPHRFTVDRGDA